MLGKVDPSSPRWARYLLWGISSWVTLTTVALFLAWAFFGYPLNLAVWGPLPAYLLFDGSLGVIALGTPFYLVRRRRSRGDRSATGGPI